jgi:hypothetical protein
VNTIVYTTVFTSVIASTTSDVRFELSAEHRPSARARDLLFLSLKNLAFAQARSSKQEDRSEALDLLLRAVEIQTNSIPTWLELGMCEGVMCLHEINAIDCSSLHFHSVAEFTIAQGVSLQ